MPGSGRTSTMPAARAAALGALVASLMISGCSSSKKAGATSPPATTSAAPSTPVSTSTSAAPVAADAATTAAVTKAYTTLFDANAGVAISAKTAVLQDGPAFGTDILALSKSPLTKGLSVSVTGVSLLTATKAKVQFSLLMSGKVLLAGQSGYALLQSGTWKVAADTLCGLLSLQGTGVPPACTSPAAALP